MADTTYTYHGPPSGVTLQLGNRETREVLLHPDKVVDLPEDHPYVKRLIAQQRLRPLSAPRSSARKSSPRGETRAATQQTKESA